MTPQVPLPHFRSVLHGERFSGHEVPLEVLKDFAVFEEMLIEVAKREYLADHPERARIPRGFTKGLELRLAQLEPGSVALSMVLVGPSSGDASAYVGRAHDKIVNSIANFSQPELPPEMLRYFDRLGRSLLPGERIAFLRDNGKGEASLTPQVRKELLRASQAEEWTEEALLKGKVPEADVANGRFELELTDGTKLKAPLDAQHKASIIGALGGYPNRMLAVKGILRSDKHGTRRSIDSVEHVTELDPLDVEVRLEELAALGDGWLNGRGQALDKAGLKVLAQGFDEFFDSALPLPYLYPTAEGGVVAEWTLGDWEVSLEVQMPGCEAVFQALHPGADESRDLEFNLGGPPDWATLNAELRELAQARHE